MNLPKLFFLAVSSLGLAFGSSCSTTKGFGQDLQKVGNRLEQSAESTGGTAPAQDPYYSAPGAAYGASSNPAAY